MIIDKMVEYVEIINKWMDDTITKIMKLIYR